MSPKSVIAVDFELSTHFEMQAYHFLDKKI